MSAPIYFPPAPFDLGHAVSCAHLVETAYTMYQQWQAEGSPRHADAFDWKSPAASGYHYSQPIWSSERAIFRIFNESEPFAFVATEEATGDAYVVFRGTESSHDWIDDADVDHEVYDLVVGFGRAHHGFLRVYKSLRDELLAQLGALASVPARLFVTGHSLGSGLSTLAVPDILRNTPIGTGGKTSIQHYNFACPRTGDPVFASQMEATGVPTYRFVNTADLVPCIPPSVFRGSLYEHVGTQISFTAQYGSTGGNHSMTGCYGYAIAHPSSPSSSGR